MKITKNQWLTLVLISVVTCASAQSEADFIKKWHIEEYIYMGIGFDPDEEEVDDYIHFFDDGTFESTDKGTEERGTWQWKNSRNTIVLSQDGESIEIEVVKLSKTELIVLLEEDGESIKIKYVSN